MQWRWCSFSYAYRIFNLKFLYKNLQHNPRHMKTLRYLIGLMTVLTLLSACSSHLYPLGRKAKRGYKKNLKTQHKSYKEFSPVKLDLDTLKSEQYTAPSPNFNIRTPQLVVIHYTAQQSCEQSLK